MDKKEQQPQTQKPNHSQNPNQKQQQKPNQASPKHTSQKKEQF